MTSSRSTSRSRARKRSSRNCKAAAKSADRILLAADPDREGEAICQHLKEILDGNKAEIFRVLFNEITPKAIKAAVENPGRINQNIVDAQQARRILDRLVGYQISPLLWDKVRRGISAGRVQTVALRLIVEREREIQAFKPEEYWSITAKLEGHQPPPFDAKLAKIKGKTAEVTNQAGGRSHSPEPRRARRSTSIPSSPRKRSAIRFRRSPRANCSRMPRARCASR